VVLYRQHDFAAAIPLLTREVSEHEGNAAAWRTLGLAYAELGKYDDAAPAFRRACEIGTKMEDACYFAGRALYDLGRFEESLDTLKRSDPKNWMIRLGMGRAEEALGQPAAAERDLRAAAGLCANADPRPGVALGLFLVRQGRTAEAVAPLEETLRKYPESADAHTYLGRALLESGDVQGALSHLERAVAIAPASAQAHLLLAKAYTRSGRAEDAQKHLEAAAKYGQEK